MRYSDCHTIARKVAKKAHEAASPHKVRLTPLDTNQLF